MSENDRATARIARMEAQVAGSSIVKSEKSLKNGSEILQNLQNLQQKQQKQLQYLMILIMFIGIGLLIYSFINKRDN